MNQDFRWLITNEIPHLRRFARSLLGDVTSADDLVQDTLEKAMKKHKLWQKRKGTIRTWLFRILYTTYVNKAKKMAKMQTMDTADMPESWFAHQQTPEKQMMVKQVVESLKQLPDEQRSALLLVTLEGMPYEEAARVLGIRLGTLRSRVSRARAYMRDVSKEKAPQHLEQVK